MFGQGLLTGMGITWKHLWGKKSTVCYPEEKLPMTEHFRGGHLVLDTTKCVGCKLCAMQCPNQALQLTVVMDENKKRHLTEYKHTLGRCLYCDLCIENCNFHALSWDKNFAISSWNASDMVYDAVAEAKKRQPAEALPVDSAPEAKGGEEA